MFVFAVFFAIGIFMVLGILAVAHKSDGGTIPLGSFEMDKVGNPPDDSSMYQPDLSTRMQLPGYAEYFSIGDGSNH